MAKGLRKAKEQDEIVKEKIKERKKEIDRQNKIIDKVRDLDNIAILSRFTELNQNARIETVKLPSIYKNQNLNERHDAGYTMLQDFQKLLQTRLES